MLQKPRVTKFKKTYAAVFAVETTTVNLKTDKIDENRKSHDINKSIRIEGIPEDPNKTKKENVFPKNYEVNNLLSPIGVNAHVIEIQRLGNF